MGAGQRIKEKREELGLTQEELALRLGYKSRSSVNKVENSRDLSLKLVNEYAKALNCSASYLLGWDDMPNSKEDKYLSSDIAIKDITTLRTQKKVTDADVKMFDSYLDLSESKKKIIIDLVNTLTGE